MTGARLRFSHTYVTCTSQTRHTHVTHTSYVTYTRQTRHTHVTPTHVTHAQIHTNIHHTYVTQNIHVAHIHTSHAHVTHMSHSSHTFRLVFSNYQLVALYHPSGALFLLTFNSKKISSGRYPYNKSDLNIYFISVLLASDRQGEHHNKIS